MVFVVTHWINLVSMILLILTGFIIHYPFIAGIMGICRGVHLFCGFVLFFKSCMGRSADKARDKKQAKTAGQEGGGK